MQWRGYINNTSLTFVSPHPLTVIMKFHWIRLRMLGGVQLISSFSFIFVTVQLRGGGLTAEEHRLELKTNKNGQSWGRQSSYYIPAETGSPKKVFLTTLLFRVPFIKMLNSLSLEIWTSQLLVGLWTLGRHLCTGGESGTSVLPNIRKKTFYFYFDAFEFQRIPKQIN